jgi:phage shock protein PspC (stress-responsive transcriptional regulator)
MYDMNPSSPTSHPKRLTRSTSDRKILGVCGGLAAHLGIDPVIVRIAFVATAICGGAGLVAYVAMLAFVPSDDKTDDVPAGAEPLAA